MMALRPLLRDLVRGLPSYADLLAGVRQGEDRLVVSGGVGALPAIFSAALAEDLGRPFAAIVPNEKDAERFLDDLAAAGSERVFQAPAPTLTPYQRIPASLKSRRDEFALLAALRSGAGPVAAVLPARSLFVRLPAPEDFERIVIRLARGAEVSLSKLVERLTRLGYRRGDLVVETGDLAVRGGLFDVFPPDRDLAVRVELDGDTISSLRLFDPDTQRSREKLDEVVLPPFAAAEESDEARRLLDRAHRASAFGGRADRVRPGRLLDARPAGSTTRRTASSSLVEPAAIEEEIEAFAERLASDRDPDRDAFSPEELMHPAGAGPRAARRNRACDSTAWASAPAARGSCGFPPRRSRATRGAPRRRPRISRRRSTPGEEVFVASRPTGGAEKLKRLALEYGFHVSSERGPGAVVSIPAEISAGFRLREPASRGLLGGGDLRRGAPLGGGAAQPSEAFLSDLRDLKLGDAVVHADYGIGRFKGLKRVPVEGEEREFMEIEYAEGKTLLLPVERLDLVQKYSGVEGVEPVLDRLGGAGWARRKASVRKAMRDMTDQLLKLYARRSLADGFAFSKDSPWQKEFEDAFEYVETPDQAQAIADVKRDMQSAKPMDRLLCGDVGYGKTEVAMRAAFKAVLDGKQVAVLAPTTILADQHFRTFRRRFAAFPVVIELLSRFRSRARAEGDRRAGRRGLGGHPDRHAPDARAGTSRSATSAC